MKKIIIGLVLLLQSCVSDSTIARIKAGQLYEYGENPYELDTIRIISTKEGYVKYYSFNQDTTFTSKLFDIAYHIENIGDCKLITKNK